MISFHANRAMSQIQPIIATAIAMRKSNLKIRARMRFNACTVPELLCAMADVDAAG